MRSRLKHLTAGDDDPPVMVETIHWMILQLNAALDTGRYDSLPVDEALAHVGARDVVPWLKQRVPDVDMSVMELQPNKVDQYHEALGRIHEAYAGDEARKWLVSNRGLCLLIAWTNELLNPWDGHEA